MIILLTRAQRNAARDALGAKLAGELDRSSGDHALESYEGALRALSTSSTKVTALLRAARDALGEELHAAGPDEVREHAVLRRHARVFDRLNNFLKK